LVSGNLVEGVKVDADAAFEQLNQPSNNDPAPPPAFPETTPSPEGAASAPAENDDVKAMMEAVKQDAAKK
jgi:hypothetical protein